MRQLKLAVPDLISNSYFPAIAAVELGCFRKYGHDVSLQLLAPVERAYAALREGSIDFVGGSSHSMLSAFPEWRGAKLLCAQGQGTYWFLVMHAALKPQRGDLSIVKGRFIGAAPWVGLTLRHLLTTAGIDLIGDSVTIAPVPGTEAGNINFGVAAAKALEDRKIDGFWANGMGAEVAVQSGTGVIVLDVRRGDGPEGCFHYTMASIAAADRLIEGSPEIAADAVRAVVDAQRALKADPGLALQIGRKLFPPTEAALIGELIRRDLPFYDPEIPQQAVDGMICFARSSGLMERKPRYDEIVAERFSALWQ